MLAGHTCQPRCCWKNCWKVDCVEARSPEGLSK